MLPRMACGTCGSPPRFVLLYGPDSVKLRPMRDRAILAGASLFAAITVAAPWIATEAVVPGVTATVWPVAGETPALTDTRDEVAQGVALVGSADLARVTDQTADAGEPMGSVSPSLSPENTEAGMNAGVVGTWTMVDHGRRTITIEADGTATMRVDLDLLGAMFYGRRLDLNLTWSVTADVMTQILESGEPAGAVGRLIRDFGSRREYRIVQLTDTEMHLQEVGVSRSPDVWTAVPGVK